MAMNKIKLFLLAILSIWAFPDWNSAAHHHAAPSPSVDCTSVILSMADCLSYVSSGGTVTKPEGNCCSGLKTVLKTNAECICVAFKNSAQFGITLNITKAMTLPAACHVSAPSLTNCGISIGSGPAPAPFPIAWSPSSAHGAGASEVTPALPPGSSGSSVLCSSVVPLVLSLVLASFSLF